MSHTIVLVQLTSKPSSRTYSDFESLDAAMDGVCKLYEQRLQQLNPDVRKITYDIGDLYTFIDSLGDLSCLTFNEAHGAYLPRDKEWIKGRVFNRLKKVAQGR